jgi:hypothetical protein
MSSQNYQTDAFRFKRAAFLQSLKSKIGLAASKAAALRINLNIQGCGIVAAPVHAPSHAPLLLPLLLSHYPSPPRSLVRDGQTSPLRPQLVVSCSTCPQLSVRAAAAGRSVRENLAARVSRSAHLRVRRRAHARGALQVWNRYPAHSASRRGCRRMWSTSV